MAGYSKRNTYIGTGVQTALDAMGSKDVTYAVSDNGANSSTVAVEVLVGSGWYADENYLIGKPRTFEGPVDGIRANITNMGTASQVYLDVTARGRIG